MYTMGTEFTTDLRMIRALFSMIFISIPSFLERDGRKSAEKKRPTGLNIIIRFRRVQATKTFLVFGRQLKRI